MTLVAICSHQVNPWYSDTYVFPNDFPALTYVHTHIHTYNIIIVTLRMSLVRSCVMCFHPHSDVTLPVMQVGEVCSVIEEWMRRLQELGQTYLWVQIFENKGAIMGCSNPHPHCQIWASSFMPSEAAKSVSLVDGDLPVPMV